MKVSLRKDRQIVRQRLKGRETGEGERKRGDGEREVREGGREREL